MSSTTIRRHAINVRALAEFALEHGDLMPQAMLIERMQDGIKGHKHLQGKYPEGYRSEVPVKLEAKVNGVPLLVQGRVDGLDLTGDPPLVDEIKTTQRDVTLITPDDYPEHWAQAEIYAHMLARKHNLAAVRVRLSYFNLSGGLSRFERTHTAEQLAALFQEYALPYARWLVAVEHWRRRSLPTIRVLGFPFESFRAGQRDMAKSGYVAIRESKILLCEAPTGTGKTAGALFPALKALGEGLIERVFYLTARTTTRQVAEATIERMRARGLALRSVTLTAKEKMCLHPGERCTPDLCARARGYFDRRRGALQEGLSLERLARADIEALAERHCLCPFELSLDLSEIAEVVICDYNHAFDPKVKLKRFFMDGGDYALLVDEAHNLVDRSRDMLSASLRQRDIESLRRALGKATSRKSAAYRALSELIAAFKALRAEHDEPAMELEPPASITQPLIQFTERAQPLLSEPLPCAGRLAEVYFAALDYLRVQDGFGESHRALLLPDGKALEIKLWCYDASDHLNACMKSVHGSVLFSATLSPMHHYQQALGLRPADGDALLRLPSPFPPEHLLVARLPLQTRYRSRAQSAPDVARAILGMCRAKKGNYLACFPSHAYLRQVLELLECASGLRLIVQRANMDDQERAEFLSQFREDGEHSMLALVAMGGIFAEGIDLPGDLLSGAAIVGVGIPQISFERDALRELMDDGQGGGYHRAYTYPGIERVLQAAGRVIRTERDRGVVLLIDERFGRAEYRALLPEHWRVRPARDLGALDAMIRSFWAGNL